MGEEEKKAFDTVVKAIDGYIAVHNRVASINPEKDFSDPYYMLGVTFVNDMVEEVCQTMKYCKTMIGDSKEVRKMFEEICEEKHVTIGELAYEAVMKRMADGMINKVLKDMPK